jgi:hypothetical protein
MKHYIFERVQCDMKLTCIRSCMLPPSIIEMARLFLPPPLFSKRRNTHLELELGSGGTPGETLVTGEDSLVTELLPELSALSTIEGRVSWNTYSIRSNWLYSADVSFVLSRRKQIKLTGHTLRPAWSTSLDLSSSESDSEVGNVSRLGLTGPVRGHDTPVVLLGELDTEQSACGRMIGMR